MKKLILALLMTSGFVIGARAQFVTFDNTLNDANPNQSPHALSGGFIYVEPSVNVFLPLNQDVNFTLLGGASPDSLTPIASLTFANGLAQGDVTPLGVPGVFFDQSGMYYAVPGVSNNGMAYVEVEAWMGTAPTYAAAVQQQGDGPGITAISGVFQNPTGGTRVGTDPPPIPSSLIGMPSFAFVVPEPATFAIAGLGAAALLLFRRKK